MIFVTSGLLASRFLYFGATVLSKIGITEHKHCGTVDKQSGKMASY